MPNGILKWLAGFFSNVLRNPVEVEMIATILESDPNTSPQVKADMATVLELGRIYAAKENGWLMFQPDAAGTAPQQIVHIAP